MLRWCVPFVTTPTKTSVVNIVNATGPTVSTLKDRLPVNSGTLAVVLEGRLPVNFAYWLKGRLPVNSGTLAVVLEGRQPLDFAYWLKGRLPVNIFCVTIPLSFVIVVTICFVCFLLLLFFLQNTGVTGRRTFSQYQRLSSLFS